MVFYKDGVKVRGIAPEIVLAIDVADQCFEIMGHVSMTVTSVVDGKHSTASLHYIGHAVDIRTKTQGIALGSAEHLAVLIRKRLTDEFDVVVEKDHLHIEFQPKH